MKPTSLLASRGLLAHVDARHLDLAVGRLDQAEHRPHRRRLARAVGPDQPADLARRRPPATGRALRRRCRSRRAGLSRGSCACTPRHAAESTAVVIPAWPTQAIMRPADARGRHACCSPRRPGHSGQSARIWVRSAGGLPPAPPRIWVRSAPGRGAGRVRGRSKPTETAPKADVGFVRRPEGPAEAPDLGSFGAADPGSLGLLGAGDPGELARGRPRSGAVIDSGPTAGSGRMGSSHPQGGAP